MWKFFRGPQKSSRQNCSGVSQAERLVFILREKSLHVALAESCTAGLVADAIARVPGASQVLWGSFVSYTIDAKNRMLGIERDLIEKYGAVARPVL